MCSEGSCTYRHSTRGAAPRGSQPCCAGVLHRGDTLLPIKHWFEQAPCLLSSSHSSPVSPHTASAPAPLQPHWHWGKPCCSWFGSACWWIAELAREGKNALEEQPGSPQRAFSVLPITQSECCEHCCNQSQAGICWHQQTCCESVLTAAASLLAGKAGASTGGGSNLIFMAGTLRPASHPSL